GYELQATSPQESACTGATLDGCLAFPSEAAGDLHYVGASSDAPAAVAAGGSVADGILSIATTSFGEWITPGLNLDPSSNGTGVETFPVVDIDTQGTSAPDYEAYPIRFPA